MSTPQQLEANRQNSKLSTGPVTEEGKQRSARNATRHCFTGQSLVITEQEKDAYEEHVKGFQAEYVPEGQIEINLVQQLADLHWSIHQIFVQQANLIALINSITVQLAPDNNPLATSVALNPLYRSLNNLSLYDQRRRRAAHQIEERIVTLRKEKSEAIAKELAEAALVYNHYKAKGETWDPASRGFVCSLTDIEEYLLGQSIAKPVRKPQSIQDLIAESEAIAARFGGKQG